MQITKIFFCAVLLASFPCGALLAQSPPAGNVAPPAAKPMKLSEEFAKLFTKILITSGQSDTLSKTGDRFAKDGDWQSAQSYYQQALEQLPTNQDALYGLMECSKATGDTQKEIEYYRKAVYSSNPASMGFGEGDTNRLMNFVLLLNQTGNTSEALYVYQHAAFLLNYEDGKQHLKVLLPEVVAVRTLGDQVRYTPERLQALAETAIAHEEMGFGSDKEAVSHMQDAVKLYPDSPVTYYYLGDSLLVKDRAGAKAAYQKAVQFGDAQTAAAVRNQLGTPL
ncbi:MAG: tetratricopeptide repeat protein [Armatimonadota bacterium]|nr:tetratricopeptide repeat protein [Armatimonadota bacterium]